MIWPSHPDKEDLQNAGVFVKEVFEKIKRKRRNMNIKEKFAKFMYGRYRTDRLNMFLLIVLMVCAGKSVCEKCLF